MSRILGVVGKAPNGASTYSVECSGCARVYQVTNTRARLASQTHCQACKPLKEMAAHARAVANAEGTIHRFKPSEAVAAGKIGGRASAAKQDMAALQRLSMASRSGRWVKDRRPLWQRALEARGSLAT